MPIKHTKEKLEEIIKLSTTWADVCRKLNIKPATGAQTYITKRAKLYNINHSHFLGKAHGRGKKSIHKKSAMHYINNNIPIKSDKLKKKLIEEKIKKYSCERCKKTKWCGEKIPLELDHKDSNHENNSMNNIWIICPNCHAQITHSRKFTNR